MNIRKALLLFVFTFSQFACSYAMETLGVEKTGSSDDSSNDASTLPPEQLQAAAFQILSQNCASCHGTKSGSGGVYGLNSVDHLIASGLVVPGNPSQSPLFAEIQSGDMPPTGPLANSDQEIIRLWIAGLNPPTTNPTPTPSPSPSPTPTVTPTPTPSPTPPAGPLPQFAYIEKQILAPKCVACHSTNNARASVALDTYQNVLKLVNKKSPSKSRLYSVTQSGSMPPGSRKPLNSDELRLILTWIENGALNN